MEPTNQVTEPKQDVLRSVTPLSKYLAHALFIAMPFLGGWIGYEFAPEKVVEVEKLIKQDKTSPFDFNDNEIRFIYNLGPGDKRTLLPDNLRVLQQGDNIYLMGNVPMSDDSIFFREIPGADIGTLEFLGHGYFKDKNKVYYIDYLIETNWQSQYDVVPTVLSADPATFKVDIYKGGDYQDDIEFQLCKVRSDEDIVLGISGGSVFHKGLRLEGIDANTMELMFLKESRPKIIRDADTVWLPQEPKFFCGDSGALYRQGTLEELSNYTSVANGPE
jgi:hypothetical protein